MQRQFVKQHRQLRISPAKRAPNLYTTPQYVTASDHENVSLRSRPGLKKETSKLLGQGSVTIGSGSFDRAQCAQTQCGYNQNSEHYCQERRDSGMSKLEVCTKQKRRKNMFNVEPKAQTQFGNSKQTQRDNIKLSAVCVPKRGKLQLNSMIELPKTNHLPHVTCPGDLSASWGSNKVQSVLSHPSPSITTSIYQVMTAAAGTDKAMEKKYSESNFSVQTEVIQRENLTDVLKELPSCRNVNASKFQQKHSHHDFKQASLPSAQIADPRNHSSSFRDVLQTNSHQRVGSNASIYPKLPSSTIDAAENRRLLQPILAKIANMHMKPRLEMQAGVRRSISLQEPAPRTDSQWPSFQANTLSNTGSADMTHEPNTFAKRSDEMTAQKRDKSNGSSHSQTGSYLNRPKLQPPQESVGRERSSPSSLVSKQQLPVKMVMLGVQQPIAINQRRNAPCSYSYPHSLCANLCKPKSSYLSHSAFNSVSHYAGRSSLKSNLLEKSLSQGTILRFRDAEHQHLSKFEMASNPCHYKSLQDPARTMPGTVMTAGQMLKIQNHSLGSKASGAHLSSEQSTVSVGNKGPSRAQLEQIEESNREYPMTTTDMGSGTRVILSQTSSAQSPRFAILSTAKAKPRQIAGAATDSQKKDSTKKKVLQMLFKESEAQEQPQSTIQFSLHSVKEFNESTVPRKPTGLRSSSKQTALKDSRRNSHVFLGTELSNNPVSIHNMIKNRSSQNKSRRKKKPSQDQDNEVFTANRQHKSAAEGDNQAQLPVYCEDQSLVSYKEMSSGSVLLGVPREEKSFERLIVSQQLSIVDIEVPGADFFESLSNEPDDFGKDDKAKTKNLARHAERTTGLPTMLQTNVSMKTLQDSNQCPSHDNQDINIVVDAFFSRKSSPQKAVADVKSRAKGVGAGQPVNETYTFFEKEFLLEVQQTPQKGSLPIVPEAMVKITSSPARLVLPDEAKNVTAFQKIALSTSFCALTESQERSSASQGDTKRSEKSPQDRHAADKKVIRNFAQSTKALPKLASGSSTRTSYLVRSVRSQNLAQFRASLNLTHKTQSQDQSPGKLKKEMEDAPAIPRHKNLMTSRQQWLEAQKDESRPRDSLVTSFFESMDEVTKQRALRIRQEMLRDRQRIRHFKDQLKRETEQRQTSSPKLPQATTGAEVDDSSPARMNEFIHFQMQLNHKSGRLTRTSSQPYNNVSFKPNHSPNYRVKRSTVRKMKNEFESSVGISQFNTNGGAFNDSTHLSQQEINPQEILAKKSAPTKTQKGSNEVDSQGEDAPQWSQMPIVKPLDLKQISNPDIQEILLREQHSCQHFSIVATPKALRDGARFNIDREEKIVVKRTEEAEKFELQRKKTQEEKAALWAHVKGEFCHDFEAEKQKEKKLRIKENLKKFCRNFIEQYEILTQKMKVHPRLLRNYKLFPIEPFERGDVPTFLKHCKQNKLEDVSRMLKLDPLMVYQFDEMHQSGLIWAAKRNHPLMVRMLLKAHSRVNFRDMPGRTALHFAVMNNNEEMVRILLCFKADPNIEDNQGVSSMSLFTSLGKKLNLKIGAHMKLASHNLFRQKYLIDFVYKAQLQAVAVKQDKKNSSSQQSSSEDTAAGVQASRKAVQIGWTRRELRDKEWKKEVIDVLDRYGTIQDDELQYL